MASRQCLYGQGGAMFPTMQQTFFGEKNKGLVLFFRDSQFHIRVDSNIVGPGAYRI